jgi:hypothetical protein
LLNQTIHTVNPPNTEVDKSLASCKIDQKYKELISKGVDIGTPISNVKPTNVSQGYYQNFTKGVIYTSPTTGTFNEVKLTRNYVIRLDGFDIGNTRSPSTDTDTVTLNGQIPGVTPVLTNTRYLGDVPSHVPLGMEIGPFPLTFGSGAPLKFDYLIYNKYGGGIAGTLQDIGIGWLDKAIGFDIVGWIKNIPIIGGVFPGACDGPVAIYKKDITAEMAWAMTNGNLFGSTSNSYPQTDEFLANLPWVSDHPWGSCRDSGYFVHWTLQEVP